MDHKGFNLQKRKSQDLDLGIAARHTHCMMDQALETTLHGCRVAEMLHGMYESEKERRFVTNYGRDYGYMGRFRTTRPDMLIARCGGYGHIDSITTPLGTLQCTYGSTCKRPGGEEALQEALSALDFDMVLIRETQSYKLYQITRVGGTLFPLHPYEEVTYMSDAEAKESRNLVAEQVMRQRIHTDRLGLTEKLLTGQPISVKDLVTNARGYDRYYDWLVKLFDQHYQQGVIRWDLWWQLIYATGNSPKWWSY